jgi:hypothetical protein
MNIARFAILATLAVALFSASLSAATDRKDTSDYTIGDSVQPLVIIGEGWSQTFTIVNVDYYEGGEPTNGTLRFYDTQGQPWRIPIKGQGMVDWVPVNLASGQMVAFETEVSFEYQQLGWARLELPDSDARGIYHAYTVFRKQQSGQADLMTAVPFVDDIEDELIIPFDTREGKYPGLSLVNTWTSEDTITVRAYDSAGGIRAEFSKTVPAQGMVWFSLLGEFPQLAGFEGQLKVLGGTFTAAFSLQFTPNGAFTAVPMVHTYGLQ